MNTEDDGPGARDCYENIQKMFCHMRPRFVDTNDRFACAWFSLVGIEFPYYIFQNIMDGIFGIGILATWKHFHNMECVNIPYSCGHQLSSEQLDSEFAARLLP